jgi:hypothetical protein
MCQVRSLCQCRVVVAFIRPCLNHSMPMEYYYYYYLLLPIITY